MEKDLGMFKKSSLSAVSMLEIVFMVATIFVAFFYCIIGHEMLRCIGAFFGMCWFVFYLESKEEGLEV